MMSNEGKFLNVYIFQLALSNQLVDAFFASWNKYVNNKIFASKKQKILLTIKKNKDYKES